MDVLTQAGLRVPLLEAIGNAGRLVILGDLLELRHGPIREALERAAPVLAAIGSALPAEAEVLLVPGNHDHLLLRPWLARRALFDGAALGLEAEVDWRPGELLDAVVGALGVPAARVRVRYPGVWLREDVYATHGHYGDRHSTVPILERLGAGAIGRIIGEPAHGPLRVEDYEATLGTLYRWIDAVVAARRMPGGRTSIQVRIWRQLGDSHGRGRRPLGLPTLQRAGLAAAFPLVVAGLNRAGLGPLQPEISGPSLRRAALQGFGEVLARLQVDAAYVLFGHTHRAGPLPADDASEWIAPTGSSMLNTGSWVLERSFLGSDAGRSPYRPGFSATVSDRVGEGPVLRPLLDEAFAEARA